MHYALEHLADVYFPVFYCLSCDPGRKHNYSRTHYSSVFIIPCFPISFQPFFIFSASIEYTQAF